MKSIYGELYLEELVSKRNKTTWVPLEESIGYVVHKPGTYKSYTSYKLTPVMIVFLNKKKAKKK